MNRLVLGGGVVLSAASLVLFFGITIAECSQAFGNGVCIVTHPIWPLAMLPIGLALVGLSFLRGSHKSTESSLSGNPP